MLTRKRPTVAVPTGFPKASWQSGDMTAFLAAMDDNCVMERPDSKTEGKAAIEAMIEVLRPMGLSRAGSDGFLT